MYCLSLVTMFENCKWTGTIEIISASSSTCRFADWDYEQGQKDIQESLPEYYDTHYKPETNKLTGKRFLFLNRRLRNHRILLLAELLKRKTNIDADFYMSFLGSEFFNLYMSPYSVVQLALLGFATPS